MSENQDTTEQTEVVAEEVTGEVKTEEVKSEEKKGDDLPIGVQKRINKITAQKYELESKVKELEEKLSTKSETEETTEEGSDTEFVSKSEFEKLLAEREAKIKAEQTEKQRADELAKGFQERAEKFAEEHPDFVEVVYSANVTLPNDVAQEVAMSDKSAELTYHFAKNPEDAQRLHQMTTRQRMSYITKLEESGQATNNTSSAPAPVPDTNGQPAVAVNPENMSVDEWIKQRNKKEGL